MRRALLAAAVALSACATAPPPPPPLESPSTPDEIQAIRTALLGCQLQKLTAFDDGVSDASTVASAVSAACPIELDSLIAAIGKGQSMYRKDALRESRDQLGRSLALQTILTVRVRRKDGAQH